MFNHYSNPELQFHKKQAIHLCSLIIPFLHLKMPIMGGECICYAERVRRVMCTGASSPCIISGLEIGRMFLVLYLGASGGLHSIILLETGASLLTYPSFPCGRETVQETRWRLWFPSKLFVCTYSQMGCPLASLAGCRIFFPPAV